MIHELQNLEAGDLYDITDPDFLTPGEYAELVGAVGELVPEWQRQQAYAVTEQETAHRRSTGERG